MLTLLALSPHLIELNLALDFETRVGTFFELRRHFVHDARWLFLECHKYHKAAPDTLERMLEWCDQFCVRFLTVAS